VNGLDVLVPVRGGSVRVPRKSFELVGSASLLERTVGFALAHDAVSRVVVSSDDPDVLALAPDLGAHPLRRPASLAGSTTPMSLVIEHAFESAPVADDLLVLQSTTPFRRPSDLDSVIETGRAHPDATVVSVTELAPSTSWLLCGDASDGGLRPLDAGRGVERSQDGAGVFTPNGAYYLVRRATFVADRGVLSGPLRHVLIDFPWTLDIDTPDDLALARRILDTGAWDVD